MATTKSELPSEPDQQPASFYCKVAWQNVILRFWVDIAAVCLVMCVSFALALIPFMVGHAAWGLEFQVLRQAFSALAFIYLALVLASTIKRHLRMSGMILNADVAMSSSRVESKTTVAVNGAGSDAPVSRS